jgi:predicted DCC family thiol-disulfide oxidoreductase YuxK
MNIAKKSLPLTDHDPFEVFFDGDCPLCKREIEMIRNKDKGADLVLTNIAAKNFQPTDRPLETLMREIHGRYPNGQYVTGVEVFREIYQRIGFGSIVKTTRWPVVRQILDLGYRVFARLRFYFAIRRIKKGNPNCRLTDGTSATSCGHDTV